MRVFTEDEQILLRRIRDGQGRNLYSLIDPWINGVSFQVNTQTESVDFIFEANPELNLIDRLEEIQTIVIQAVNLIKLFEDNGYIFTFINANQLPPNPFTFGQAAVNVPSIPYHFPDPRLSKMFCEYSIREIFVTPELDKFISDGFLTREEVRANRQWRTTRNALLVAIVALVLNVAFNIINIVDRQKKEKTSDPIKSGFKNSKMSSNVQSDTTTIMDTITVIKTTSTVVNVKTDTIKK
ncbi:MAG: hypothetical protein VR77_03150 [Flavobacteriales bacterium BRH_c54]|nr:MAG: hypothetical protein VR77_03150 [Flavobacteriales bacterium BRH_c54]